MLFVFCYNQLNDIYSFKYSGISNSLDGNGDDQFRGNEDIEKGNGLFKLKMMSYI